MFAARDRGVGLQLLLSLLPCVVIGKVRGIEVARVLRCPDEVLLLLQVPVGVCRIGTLHHVAPCQRGVGLELGLLLSPVGIGAEDRGRRVVPRLQRVRLLPENVQVRVQSRLGQDVRIPCGAKLTRAYHGGVHPRHDRVLPVALAQPCDVVHHLGGVGVHVLGVVAGPVLRTTCDRCVGIRRILLDVSRCLVSRATCCG